MVKKEKVISKTIFFICSKLARAHKTNKKVKIYHARTPAFKQ